MESRGFLPRLPPQPRIPASYSPFPTFNALLITPMKLTLTIDGLASLPRYDATRLVARLQSEFERELQAVAATSTRALDPESHRAALTGTLARLTAR